MATTKVKLLDGSIVIPTGAVATTQSASDNTTKVATTAYVTTAISNLSDSAPSTLNTLNELAAALGDDANYATTTTNAIAAKLPLAGGTMTGALIVTDGSASAPSIGNSGDTNTGIYFPADDQLGLVIGGSRKLLASSAGITVNNGDLIVDTDKLVVDISAGHVGMGTASPSSFNSRARNLVVNSDGDTGITISANTSSSSTLIFADAYAGTGGTAAYRGSIEYDHATDHMAISTAATERVRIASDGKIGVGTTSPNRTLSVSTGLAKTSTTTAYPFAIQSNESSGNAQLSVHAIGGASAAVRRWLIQCEEAGVANAGNIQFNPYGGGVSIGSAIPNSHHSKANRFIVGSGGATGMSVYNGTGEGWYAFSRDNANNTDAYDGGMSYNGDRHLKFHTNAGAVRMRIDGSGDGQFYGSWSLEDNKKLQLGGGADLQIWHDGSDSYISDEGSGHLLFRTGAEFYWGDTSGNNRMRLNVGANPELRVGTTNDYSSTILGYCTHSTDASITAESNTGSYTGEVFVASSTRNSANATYRLIQAQRRGYAVVFTVNDAGNAQNANNSWTGISDERLKINIEDAGSQWDDIKKLRVRKYQWGHGNVGHTQIGLVSQEVEAAGMAGLVEESPADEYQIAYNPALEGEKVKTMKYSVLYMKAVKALQEAIKRIETLEDEVKHLKDG